MEQFILIIFGAVWKIAITVSYYISQGLTAKELSFQRWSTRQGVLCYEFGNNAKLSSIRSKFLQLLRVKTTLSSVFLFLNAFMRLTLSSFYTVATSALMKPIETLCSGLWTATQTSSEDSYSHLWKLIGNYYLTTTDECAIKLHIFTLLFSPNEVTVFLFLVLKGVVIVHLGNSSQ